MRTSAVNRLGKGSGLAQLFMEEGGVSDLAYRDQNDFLQEVSPELNHERRERRGEEKAFQAEVSV